MKAIWVTLFLFGGPIALAESVRSLSCEFSLPSGVKETLSAPINEGKAKVVRQFEARSTTYIVTAEVWGFSPSDRPRRTAGYLQVKQVQKTLTEPRTYAINHCELADYRDACHLQIVTMLNGVGTHANCTVPEL